MQMSSFIYSNDEWEIDGALIVAAIEIELNWDWLDGTPTNFRVWRAERTDARDVKPVWLRLVAEAWVAANQAKLAQEFSDRALYLDAAE